MLIGSRVNAFDIFASEITNAAEDAGSRENSACLAPHCCNGLDLVRGLAQSNKSMILDENHLRSAALLFHVMHALHSHFLSKLKAGVDIFHKYRLDTTIYDFIWKYST